MESEKIKSIAWNMFKAVFIVLLGTYLLQLSIKFFATADLASMVLVASDILHGNWFLSDWYLTGITYLASDLFYYWISTGIFGISINSVIFATFLMIIVNLVTSLLLLKDDIRELKFKDFIIFVGLWGLSYITVQKLQIHGGCFPLIYLTIFACDKYFKTENKKYLIAMTSILTLGVLSDIITIVACALPILIYCIVKIFNKELIEKYFMVALCSCGAIAGGLILTKIYLVIGGADYNTWSLYKHFIPETKTCENFSRYINQVFYLVGANFYDQRVLRLQTVGFFLRALVALVGVGLSLKNLVNLVTNKKTDFISVILALGFIFVSLILITTDFNLDLYASRFFAFLPLSFCVIIMRNWNYFYDLNKPQYYTIMLALLVSVGFCLEKGLSFNVEDSKYQKIAQYLEDNNLVYGQTEYWDASMITLMSKDKVKVRPIDMGEEDSVVYTHNWFAKKEWFSKEIIEFYIAPPLKLEQYKNVAGDRLKHVEQIDDLTIYVLNK